MCNRYIPPDEAVIERFWHVGRSSPGPFYRSEIFPRSQGPFIRSSNARRELVVGQWGLIPHFAKSQTLKYNTNNARAEELSQKPSYRGPWQQGQRCIIPAASFDEPCWETGKNVWWRFQRHDGNPWGLAGLWNTWIDRATGEVFESYTMLTINADHHPIMNRMHKPDPAYGPDDQDKRSVVAIELDDIDVWLNGSNDEALQLIRAPSEEYIAASPL